MTAITEIIRLVIADSGLPCPAKSRCKSKAGHQNQAGASDVEEGEAHRPYQPLSQAIGCPKQEKID